MDLHNDVKERVLNVVSEELGFNKEDLTMDTSLFKDLGSDSLDLVELVMELEEEFGIDISEEATDNVQTIGDVVSHIEKELEKK